jgi:hypothetical protein
LTSIKATALSASSDGAPIDSWQKPNAALPVPQGVVGRQLPQRWGLN